MRERSAQYDSVHNSIPLDLQKGENKEAAGIMSAIEASMTQGKGSVSLRS